MARMQLLRPLAPSVPLCPQCSMMLQSTYPASRHDGLDMGWCPEHGQVVAAYGEPVPAEATPWPVGHDIEVEFPDGWRAGRIDGYRVDLNDDFVRVDVWLAPGRVVRGCHPKHVRAAA